MGIKNWFKRKENKASKINGLIIETQGTKEVKIKDDYVKIAQESYMMNPYVYRAIKLISDSLADLDYVLYRKVKG